jgi:hypothetical protein
MALQSHLIPLCPRDFRDAVRSDVFMIDQAGSQHVTDAVQGEEIGPDSDPNLIGMMTGVIWNSQYVTMTKAQGKGHSLDKVALDHFVLAVSLCPEGKDMRYETHSG